MGQQFQGFRAGEIVDDRYEIIDTIGQGGFGVVYRARQIAIDRVVALKVLLPEADTVDPQAVERFRREAVLISSLESPNTITLYEFGQTNHGLLYTVMEFARGETLRQTVAREGQLQPNRVVHIIKQSLSSLHEAHQRGIVHRDLKPANIMVGEYAGQTDHVKILDFGIAKILKSGDTQSTLALTGRIVGTPRYMAPEQLRGVNPTPAVDLYALGLVMYEMLTGQPAVTANDPMEQVQAQMRPGNFMLPPNLPGVTPTFLGIVNRALEKDPAKRFQAADVFSRALDGASKINVPSVDAAKTKQVDQAMIQQLQASVAQQRHAHGGHQVHPHSAPPKKKSGLGIYITFAALFFLVALGGLAFLLVSSDGTDNSDAGSSSDSGQQVDTRTQPDTGPSFDSANNRPDAGTREDTGPSNNDATGAPDQAVATNDTVTPPPDTAGGDEANQDAATPQEEVVEADVATADTGAVEVAEQTDTEETPQQDVAAADVQEQDEEPAGTATLEVTSSPSRVRLYLDGDELCRTPCDVPVPADGSSIRIRLRKTGYDSVSRDVSSADLPGVEIRLRRQQTEPDARIDIIL